MTTIKFTIRGNQENKAGNPVPYVRSTQGSKWNPRYQRYLAWKDYVRAAYFDAKFPNKKISREEFGEAHDILSRRPFTNKKVKGRVTVIIHFGDETHCDPDNVGKGLLDALFEQDKHIDLETHHTCGNKQPMLEILIETT